MPSGLVLKSAVVEAPADDGGVTLLRRAPLVAGAIVSMITVVVALTALVAAALLTGAVGLTLAARATGRPSADRAATIVSIGFGLAVGPAVYLLLAGVIELAG